MTFYLILFVNVIEKMVKGSDWWQKVLSGVVVATETPTHTAKRKEDLP